MAGRLPDGGDWVTGVRLASSADRWVSPPTVVARSLRARLTGLRPWSLGYGMLLAGASVHGRSMVEPLAVVGIDRCGRILGVERLVPGGIVRIRGAAMMLEMATSHPLPSTGARLTVRPMLARCRDV